MPGLVDFFRKGSRVQKSSYISKKFAYSKKITNLKKVRVPRIDENNHNLKKYSRILREKFTKLKKFMILEKNPKF